jgi:peptidoglycan biosynthesis protein MviN/MurJ (putative lipid II flippase)
LRIGMISFIANMVSSIALMQVWGAKGLAAANVISVIVQVYFLHKNLVIKEKNFDKLMLAGSIWKILFAGFLMAAFSYVSWEYLDAIIDSQKLAYILALVLIIPLSIAVYFAVLWFTKFEGRDAAIAYVSKIIRRR